MNRKISINLALALVIIAMTVTFSVTMIFSQSLFEDTVASVRQKETQYEKLAEIDKDVREHAYYDINNDMLYDMLGTGYMAGIQDINARYYTAEQYVNYLNEQSGVNIGIGVDIIKEANMYPQVIRTYLNSPAFDLGIANGYTLISIDGTDLKNLTLTTINALLSGTDGSTISLVYADIAGAQSGETSVQRRQYESPTVEYLQNENEVVGYIKIIDFTVQTQGELTAAIDEMKAAPQGLSGLVIDLRNNDGGSLDSALDALDVLCPSGPMGYSLTKNGTAEVLEISDNANQIDVPVVVLTNSGTAAGAELFAAGIRDFGLGQIVGEQTSGRGSIQSEPVRLSDGSAISYTIGIILTGQNEEFNGVGITPDIEAQLREDEQENFYNLSPNTDSQVQRAKEVVLRLSGVSADQQGLTIENVNSQSESESEQNTTDSDSGGDAESDSAADDESATESESDSSADSDSEADSETDSEAQSTDDSAEEESSEG